MDGFGYLVTNLNPENGI